MTVVDKHILPDFGNLDSFWEKTTTATNISITSLPVVKKPILKGVEC